MPRCVGTSYGLIKAYEAIPEASPQTTNLACLVHPGPWKDEMSWNVSSSVDFRDVLRQTVGRRGDASNVTSITARHTGCVP